MIIKYLPFDVDSFVDSMLWMYFDSSIFCVNFPISSSVIHWDDRTFADEGILFLDQVLVYILVSDTLYPIRDELDNRMIVGVGSFAENTL